eukprot:TRINITY_DN757_c0_g2_i1.p1 TRINITY_DN757_c0_g2~~TRINITY_DN757_c0_g2_i1.p1  ORF type:complete len:305 (-),score=71.98 TRINITY_DN757_c0_g2_i1:467-1381(-)
MSCRTETATWLRFRAVDLTVTFLFLVIGVILTQVEPVPRYFVERDPALSYPYIPDHSVSVPSWALGVIAIGCPLVIIVATQFFLIRRRPHTLKNAQKSLATDIPLAVLALLHAIGATLIVTNGLKVFVGRLRPNFYGMCNYKGFEDALNSGNEAAYFNLTVVGAPGSFEFCQQPLKQLIYESRFSFPSGHSSISMAGMCFLSLFLLWIIALYHPAFHAQLSGLVFAIPLGCAALIAATRIRDYWHNVDDVAIGSAIGFSIAMWSFRLHYPQAVPTVVEDVLPASESDKSTLPLIDPGRTERAEF